ncbi:glycosyltransferase [Paracoccaceae bacterium]|nr:glycosyltransferase [Paracoccaceae bacterium]
MTPIVSVITVVKNAELTIERAIRSLRSQNVSKVQYIVIDGASTDNTKKIIERNRDIINVFVSEPDNGTSEGYNKGFPHIKGKYVIWLCADDWFGENFLPTAIDALNKSNADLFFGSMTMHSPEGTLLETLEQNTDIEFCLRQGQGINFPSMMWTNSFMQKIGYLDLSLQFCNDIEWLLRAYSIKPPSCVFSNEVTIHRLNNGLVSKNASKHALELIKIYKKYEYPLMPILKILLRHEMIKYVSFVKGFGEGLVARR